MIRKQCIPHGTDEVIAVFDENGLLKNHLLRSVPQLVTRYMALDKEAATERAALEASIASRRSTIDGDVFAQAEQEILDAAAKAAPTDQV